MEYRRCAACEQTFRPRAQVPHQRYCAVAACQRERRRRWQRSKLQTDADYRANQVLARRAWADGHGDYWREYRARNPVYTDHNRLEQRRRDRHRHAARLAKMDVSTPINPVPSGTYRLQPEAAVDLAKKDVWTAKITLISKDYIGDPSRFATAPDFMAYLGLVPSESSGAAGAILQREDVIGAAGPPR